MKKYILLLTLCSTLLSCNTENTSQIKPSSSSLIKDAILTNPKPQESNTPITIIKNSTPTVNPIEKPDFSKLDVYGEGIYCEDRNKIVKSGLVDVKLDKPVNIAVTRDGSAVYVVNGKCGRKPYLENEFVSNLENDFCESRYKRDFESDVVENNLIIKITKDGNKKAIVGDNSGLFFCSNDGVIALDENDNLYFSANRRIYKVKDDKYVELAANLDELEKGSDSFYKTGMIGGLAVSNEGIYVDVRGDIDVPKRYIPTPSTGEPVLCVGSCGEGEIDNDIGEIKEIKNNELTNLFLTRNEGKSKFFVKNNLLYTLRPTINSKNFIDFDKKLFPEKWDIFFNKNTKDYYNYESQGEVSHLNIDTKIWSSLHGYDYLLNVFYDKNIKSILINSKNEFIYSFYNNIVKKYDIKNKSSYFIIGSQNILNSIEGYKDGKGNESLFNRPAGMAIDANDNIYVADTGNNAIRKITPDGTVSTFYKEL
ncbi:MAG: hypothetical protein ACK4IX_06320 [Candidatus Sericytochromatia bacterium]